MKIPSHTNVHLPALPALTKITQRSKGRALFTSVCALFAVCAGSAHAANIVSQWNFDDFANPGSTVGNIGGFTGTFFGGTVSRSANGLGVTGLSGDYSLSLGGQGVQGARVDVSTPEFLTMLNGLTGSQSLSFTYWQNLNTISTSTSLWAQSTSVQRGLNAHSPWSDGNVYWDTAGCCANGTQRLFGFLGATTNQWELITLTYENGTKTIYRGTNQIASGAGFNLLPTDLTAFYIGNESPTHDLLPNARYDNFTVWSGALTPAEIANLAVPEPSAALLLGASALIATRRRRHS